MKDILLKQLEDIASQVSELEGKIKTKKVSPDNDEQRKLCIITETLKILIERVSALEATGQKSDPLEADVYDVFEQYNDIARKELDLRVGRIMRKKK